MTQEPISHITVVSNVHKTELKTPNDYFITLTPCSDGKLFFENIAALQWISINLNKAWLPVSSSVSGITAARQYCFDVLAEFFKTTSIRGLWLDSDIRIMDQAATLEAIRYADEHNINIVGNYLRGTVGQEDNTVYHRQKFTSEDGSIVEKFDIAYTNDEIDKMPNYSKVDFAGLGFYYGYLPLTYNFMRDRMGEDFHFYYDNKLDIRLAKQVQLAHRKSQWLIPPKYDSNGNRVI